MILPKKYEDEGGKYPQHKNKPKISSSQYTSWIDPEYKHDYIVQYFSGIKLPDGIWATFGGEVGTFIECTATDKEHPEYTMLEEEDKNFLLTLDYPENCTYEDEIVLDFGDFVCQGFTDRTEYIDEKTVGILDYKTGNLEKKAEYYGSNKFSQTTIYAKQKIMEGFTVKYSNVGLLGRKGHNKTVRGTYHRIRLSGEKVLIDTPYSEERAEEMLMDIRNAANEIAECYKTYTKIFG